MYLYTTDKAKHDKIGKLPHVKDKKRNRAHIREYCGTQSKITRKEIEVHHGRLWSTVLIVRIER